jgi:hypothetical protein
MSVTELRPESWAEQSAKATKTEAEAEALRAKTAADAASREITNRLKAAKAAAEIAEGEAKAEEVRRAAEAERIAAAEKAQEERQQKEKAARSAAQWRKSARTIAGICVLVSLPLQIEAFWDPHMPFLTAAPLVLEGLAWALLKGAEAAIDDHRPSWHYRLLAGLVALFAAAVNLMHGSETYGLATGMGGAFCSLAGPMVWDLHEHGRIRKRDGKVTWRQRRAAKKADAAKTKQEAEQAAEEAEKRAAVAKLREERHPEVWKRALSVSAALGEVSPSEPTWARVWTEVHGAQLGDTVDSIAAAVAAKARAKEAAGAANAQVKSQITPPARPAPKRPERKGLDGRKNNGGRPPIRSKGDTPKYSPAARRAQSATHPKRAVLSGK